MDRNNEKPSALLALANKPAPRAPMVEDQVKEYRFETNAYHANPTWH